MSSAIPPDDLDALAYAAQRHDEDAFCELVSKLTPVLIAFFRRRGVRDPEELVQVVWLRVVQHLDGYDPEFSFATWVLAIARHLWVDLIRKESRKPPHVTFEDLPAEAEIPLDAYDREELTFALGECIELLTADERQIIRMRYWSGENLSTIAKTLASGYASIRGKAHRAAGKLRKCLRQKGFLDF